MANRETHRRLIVATRVVALTVAALALLPSSAVATTSLGDRCHYSYGAGDHQSVSYEGQTTCGEAGVLVDLATNYRQPQAEGRLSHRTDSACHLAVPHDPQARGARRDRVDAPGHVQVDRSQRLPRARAVLPRV